MLRTPSDRKPYENKRPTTWLDEIIKNPDFSPSSAQDTMHTIIQKNIFTTDNGATSQLRNTCARAQNASSLTNKGASFEVVCNKKQFGASLECIQQSYELPLEWPIPPIVQKCIAFLSVPKHLVTEGIFRQSPQSSGIKVLRDKLDAGIDIDFDEDNCVLTVAALLKSFFRELPDPLLTFAVMEDVMQFQQIPQSQRTVFIKDVMMKKLPYHNYALLKYLTRFLSMVSVTEAVQ